MQNVEDIKLKEKNIRIFRLRFILKFGEKRWRKIDKFSTLPLRHAELMVLLRWLGLTNNQARYWSSEYKKLL